MIHFQDSLRCQSCTDYGKPELDETGRILLPEDVLNSIMIQGYELKNNDVMLFCIKNVNRGTEAYAGVLSYNMSQGHVCLPNWLMDFLQCQNGDIVDISFKQNLPKATLAVFQPLDSSFFDISNTKIVLEYTLRAHPCLTQGSIIVIKFNEKTYRLKVLKTEPGPYVNSFKADLECRFAESMDKFKHHWNEPDSDSSDEGTEPKVVRGVSLNGKVTEIVEKPKPLHSTYAQREYDRLHGNTFRTKEIVQGQEILPPKPRQDRDKGQNKGESFKGEAHHIKKKKGNKGSSSNNQPKLVQPQDIPPPKQEKPTEKKNYFTGVARNIKGDSIQAPQKPQQPPQQQPEEEEKPKKSYFTGTARTLKGGTSNTANQNTNTAKPAANTQNTQPNSNSNFKGKSRTIK